MAANKRNFLEISKNYWIYDDDDENDNDDGEESNGVPYHNVVIMKIMMK